MTANFSTIPPGIPLADTAVKHILAKLGEELLPHAVIFVPTRRATITLRDAFRRATNGKPLLLPRILPMGDLGDELLTLLGTDALDVMTHIPAAMPEWQRTCLLAAQVIEFERLRFGSRVPVRLDHALRLAGDLAQLQDRFTRAGKQLSPQSLQDIFPQNYAEHWQQSLLFLSILAGAWPEIERESGMVTQAERQVLVTRALLARWQQSPPEFPIFAVGSTGSQEATAELLKTIAGLPQGEVILPGLDPEISEEEWQAIQPGHPLFHLRTLIDSPRIPALSSAPPVGHLWRHVLGITTHIPCWKNLPPYTHPQLRLVPCQHPEEETRVIALLMREAVERPDKRTALVTPDESLLDRVAQHLLRFNIKVDRLSAGTLADTQTGRLLSLFLSAIDSPERVMPLLNLLQHPLLRAGDAALWQTWKQLAIPRFRGLVLHQPGSLPYLRDAQDHPATAKVQSLARTLANLSRERMSAPQWLEQLSELMAQWIPEAGEGAEAVSQALASLDAAEMFGPIDNGDISILVAQALDKPWREPVLGAHPNLIMLTPVEARLQHFDRVIIANMQESLWPGLRAASPWLNLAQQEQLGLPAAAEQTTLMSHDLLMLGSMPEVFLTYPERDGGSPVARSPFIERLVTFMEVQGVKEETITTSDYLALARQMYKADRFSPAPKVAPKPPADQRPGTLAVSRIDELFSDPYSIYARYVLGLRKLDEMDAEPEAKDFGNLAHAAISALTAHWDEQHRAANESELAALTEQALHQFSERPNIQLFWKMRLHRALKFVNDLEAKRRLHLRQVQSEFVAEQSLDLNGSPLTLHGRIDRLEESEEGSFTIADYKTGGSFTRGDISLGKKTQLLAYALMLSEQGYRIDALDYWELPRGSKQGTIHTFDVSDNLTALLPQLRQALETMLDENTPFLARPVKNDSKDRYGSDYDGVSRYDEWAG